MSVVDEYIKAHIDWPVPKIAEGLGLNNDLVYKLIKQRGYARLKGNKPKDPNCEIKALLHLIGERKTGWAVEVAKERIKYIESTLNFN